ncbi:Spo0J Stage 0 sporulation protein J (antagonist of Soj) containing ParB-like nuclease domain [uncultured Caudovirales phage]|uniref:Spo0J Stage 0 sporulation protein J (Antagonist of Soj) containing ParB-like nuclease domain n=1 Tax=uncultured Caudovirales phage TaxID=2100421 RepID=A0A6J5LAZ8_9CAUD|nr:Spo0J Stage 0 sporulation protein J (antagonist of Soj) containing ParB-like nuclease domain [uncultured Caudovirales phage]
MNELSNCLSTIINIIGTLDIEKKIDTLNYIKEELHKISPFKNEPVDCVLWVKNDIVKANDYNPNSVAPPEMELLRQSILEDGYTQPIVSFKENESTITVVDGFHRNRVGKEIEDVKSRIFGRLPVVNINQIKQGRGDRIASTIRHNRARGTHNIELMSTIVTELVEMGKGDAWICKHVGMTLDELLRMKQITGLASLFQNREFSEAWEADSDLDTLTIKIEE